MKGISTVRNNKKITLLYVYVFKFKNFVWNKLNILKIVKPIWQFYKKKNCVFSECKIMEIIDPKMYVKNKIEIKNIFQAIIFTSFIYSLKYQ